MASDAQALPQLRRRVSLEVAEALELLAEEPGLSALAGELREQHARAWPSITALVDVSATAQQLTRRLRLHRSEPPLRA